MASRKATKRTKRSRAPSSTALGRIALIVENLQEQNQLIIEGFSGLEDRIMARMDEKLERIHARLEACVGITPRAPSAES